MTFDMQYALEHFTDILQAAPVAIWVTVFSAFLGSVSYTHLTLPTIYSV